MKLVAFIHDGKRQIGILTADKSGVLPIGAIIPEAAEWTMVDLIRYYPEGIPERADRFLADAGESAKSLLPLREVKLTAPIERPIHDIICVGVNYHAHAKESTLGLKDDKLANVPKQTVYFGKRAVKITGPEDPVVNDWELDDHLDYEVELAVIIGKGGRHIRAAKAEDHIFGYSVFNDISARKTQRGRLQWLMGKGMDTYACMGPCLVTRSDLPMPLELDLSCKVNGEMRQQSNTARLVRDVPTLIEEISAYTTLEPGDIIATGTPSGVAMGMEDPQWLVSGDLVECEIDGIGVLRNPIR